jgi:DNA repair protein RecO (recombination protein O)
VLRERNYGEADRILTLLTPFGKVSALAKGIRRATSRKVGHLGLFCRSQVLLARGRNFQIVSQAESLDEFEGLRTDLVRFTYACYAGELMDLFAQEGDESAPLYDLMVQVLHWCAEEADLSLWMRRFELRILSYGGYQPQLFHCLSCHKEIEPVPNHFSAEVGGMLCAECARREGLASSISVNAQKVLRFLVTRSPDEIRRLRLEPTTQREVESILQHYLEYVLERQLRSIAFLRQIRHELSSLGQSTPES